MLVTTCISAIAVGGKAVLGQLVLRGRASSEKFDVAYAVDQLFIGFGMFLGGYLGGKESPKNYVNEQLKFIYLLAITISKNILLE